MNSRFPATRQRGLGLATALFVITVMALLAVVIFQLVGNNAQTTEEEILLARALNAAEAGVQFGLNEVFPPNPMEASSCAASTPYTFTNGAGLRQCTATVLCSSVTVNAQTVYTVESTGTCGAVSRTVQVRAR